MTQPSDASNDTSATGPLPVEDDALAEELAEEFAAAEEAHRADRLAAYIAHYPEWAQTLARRYFTKTLNQFILHGDVRDLVPTEDEESHRQYVSLRDFLAGDLFAGRDLIIFYDRSSGIQFATRAGQADFNRALSGHDTLFGTDYAQKLPKDPVRVFALLENYIRLRLADGRRIAVILDYAETLVPMAEAGATSTEDRNALVFLQRWSHDPLFLEADFTLVLVAENLNDLHRGLIQSPFTEEILLPIPSEDERQEFIDWMLQGEDAETFKAHSDVPARTLANQTAGLGYVQLRTLLADVLENHRRLTFERLQERKKELIEAEAYGLLEFVHTERTLDDVAGHAEAKQHLRDAARAIRQGRPDVMPQGYLIAGPVGTGKTFLITCFAGEIGIPMVKLKNFRSQWQGVTEGNLEKILNLLRAMNPVAVMIDEADAALGDRNAQGDSGVSNRVFSQIAQAMSDTQYRGRIIWFLLTARPDLMPVDLKRQGRAEEHIGLFYPSTREAREELLDVMMRRTKVKLPTEEVPEALLNGDRTLSGADMEALFTRAKFRAAAEGTSEVTAETLQAVVDDFIPPTYPLEVELQTLVAVLECTSRAMLPEQYRDLDRERAVRRIEELKVLIGERR
jgi:SpoVK/Ycf46/Vps4 family AAA+-type ATPase